MLAYAEYQGTRGILALQDLPAEVRVAGFLLRLAQRLEARGIDGRALSLRVPRADLANYLGLSRATISRQISRLENAGLIQRGANWQLLAIRDREGLQARARGYEAFF